MRKLTRSPEPEALARLRRAQKKNANLDWDVAQGEDKKAIWSALDAMQEKLCAYCESELAENKRHIEHFYPRNGQQARRELRFAWANLFGSCNDPYCCGKHKDNSAKNWRCEDLIKPDQDDTDDFLQFLTSGEIHPKPGLPQELRHKAQETIRVFNLDCAGSPLRAKRMKAISGWWKSLDEILQEIDVLQQEGLYSAAEADAQKREELKKLLQQTISLPFATAIRHALVVTCHVGPDKLE
ncbi:retron Ec78 anti-phage system effector HNH endonuclease PtuB [Massilia sp. W12]|uniref:retron Ec78 anti-phage system effector HNH endonuclease PtuB n=1 Tax=Massilia sp. W12 TaxID=3126507 RepID=UPI0030CF0921